MKQYLLSPFDDGGLKNQIFNSPYGIFQKLLLKNKITINTYDLGDIETANKILFFNLESNLYQQLIKAGVTKDRLVLFAFEPRVVMPQQYDKQLWSTFGRIFTHNDELVDNKQIFKLRYPMGKAPQSVVKSYKQRKFLTLVNANKYSYVSNELYSYRRKAIRYFEQFEDFDLYGYGWERGNKILGQQEKKSAIKNRALFRYLNDKFDKSPYKSYRGSVANKYATLANYRFALTFENEINSPGYITEKIFDCLIAGAIPIYLGAPNITDFVPKECFIDMRSFKNFKDLRDYLLDVDEDQFNDFQTAGQGFLHSSKFKTWQPEAVFKSFIKGLEA